MKKLPLLTLALLLSACAQQTADQPLAEQVQVEWRSEQTGAGEFDAPLTTLSLVNTADQSVLFSTECQGTASPETIEGTTDVAILCWWAGGGERYTVVKSGDSLTVRNQTVDEEAGYGEWTDVETIAL